MVPLLLSPHSLLTAGTLVAWAAFGASMKEPRP
ncbi:hypothetical protein FHR71_003640 [Methylobacterium sp. RAS18]|nr:hypothetical protein [Methylobacterium sp. RAS18]